MPDLPDGTVSLLFTDVEGSARLLQELELGRGRGRGRGRYVEALEAHRRLLRDVFEHHGGVEVEMQGDSFFVTFASAHDAVAPSST